jgi:Uma2 family endonuclease
MTTDLRTAPLQLVRQEDGAAIDLAPLQGLWTVEQYLKLTDHTRYLVEFTDGVIEVLPLPTDKHQTILEFLFLAFRAFIDPRGGKVLFAALRL